MSKFNIILIVIIAVVLGAGGFLFYRAFQEGSLPGMTPAEKKTQELVPITTGTGKTTTQATKKIYRQTIDIDARSFFFSPDIFLVKKGEKVTVNVHAYGEHDFVIDTLKVNKKTPNGEVTTIEFTPEKEGAYHFYCSLPGHKEAGMTGTIIVE